MSKKYQRGIKLGEQVDGERVLKRVIEELKSVDEEMATHFVETTFGSVYTRGGLDLRTRELVMVAGLAVLGEEEGLKTHILGARRCGATEEEIFETLFHIHLIAGWPKAIQGIRAALSVLKRR